MPGTTPSERVRSFVPISETMCVLLFPTQQQHIVFWCALPHDRNSFYTLSFCFWLNMCFSPQHTCLTQRESVCAFPTAQHSFRFHHYVQNKLTQTIMCTQPDTTFFISLTNVFRSLGSSMLSHSKESHTILESQQRHLQACVIFTPNPVELNSGTMCTTSIVRQAIHFRIKLFFQRRIVFFRFQKPNRHFCTHKEAHNQSQDMRLSHAFFQQKEQHDCCCYTVHDGLIFADFFFLVGFHQQLRHRFTQPTETTFSLKPISDLQCRASANRQTHQAPATAFRSEIRISKASQAIELNRFVQQNTH